MNRKGERAAWALFLLAFATLACRPALTIGLGEILLIFLLGGLFFGPPIARFLLRRRQTLTRQQKSDRQQ